jgi:hypothetical protein
MSSKNADLRTSKKKPISATSVEQLQVYLKPEFKNFTQMLQPQKAGSIRPKRMNLTQTLRLIEELYSHRFGKKESTPFHEAIIDYFMSKFKSKQHVDQAAFDLLASTD